MCSILDSPEGNQPKATGQVSHLPYTKCEYSPFIFVSPMLYFYVDTELNAASGVVASQFDQTRLHRSLDLANADGRGKVFVVDGRKIPATLSGEVDSIPKKAILNRRPYRKPREISAGGGVVTKEGKTEIKVLLIYRKGLWDIPKGKLDSGETIKECAEREVQEELGTKKITMLDFLDTTTHGYADGKLFTVKTTHWYHMKTTATKFIPQKSEKITRVKWFKLSKAKEVLGHKNLIRLLNRIEHQLVYTHQSI